MSMPGHTKVTWLSLWNLFSLSRNASSRALLQSRFCYQCPLAIMTKGIGSHSMKQCSGLPVKWESIEASTWTGMSYDWWSRVMCVILLCRSPMWSISSFLMDRETVHCCLMALRSVWSILDVWAYSKITWYGFCGFIAKQKLSKNNNWAIGI